MSGEWRRLAACASHPPNAPYAAEGSAVEARFIAEVCGPCPVRRECLRWALDFDDPGVIGGLNQSQRREVRRHLRNGREPERCGTDAGYFRHRRRPEKACDSCRIAHNAATAEKANARRRVERQRRAVADRLPTADTGACGTAAGYQRHYARQQEPCEPCRSAAGEAYRVYKAARRAG